IESDLPLEIHFTDLSKLSDVTKLMIKDASDVKDAINAINQLPSAERNEFTQTVRGLSTAFIGENSIESVKEIAMKSARMGEFGTELGFYPEVSASREIIFKEFEVPSHEYRYSKLDEEWGSNSFPMKSSLSLFED